MAVAVQRPRQKRDPLDTILKGLQVAGGILGIKQAVTPQSDQLSQKELLQLQAGGQLEAVEPGTEGALPGEFAVAGQAEPVSFIRRPPSLTPAQERGFQLQERGLDIKEKQLGQNIAKLSDKIDREKKGQQTKIETDLRSEYWKSGAKETTGALRGFKKVQAAASSKEPSGANDIALVFGFMKTIDPTSTVREGEFATAQQTENIPGQVVNMYNRLIETGELLNPDQRQSFLKAAAEQLRSQLEIQQGLDDRFRSLATRAGADIEDVIDPEFAVAMDNVNQLLQQDIERISRQPNMRQPGFGEAMGAQPEDPLDKFLSE